MLREGFISGKIRLLVNEYDGEKAMNEIKGFQSLDISDRVKFTLPYVNTTLLINELTDLQYEDNAGLIKMREKAGKRKDRYSSLSYNYYVACQLERQVKKSAARSNDSEEVFLFRAPKIKQERW